MKHVGMDIFVCCSACTCMHKNYEFYTLKAESVGDKSTHRLRTRGGGGGVGGGGGLYTILCFLSCNTPFLSIRMKSQLCRQLNL